MQSHLQRIAACFGEGRDLASITTVEYRLDHYTEDVQDQIAPMAS